MKTKLLFLFTVTIFSLGRVFSATHTIIFGGTVGNAYSPNTLSVNIGDVITWQGDFQFHPLASTSVPVGAASFSHNTGATFSYTVMQEGSYSYRCTTHGFTGVFSAIAPLGIVKQNENIELHVFPTVTSGEVNIYLQNMEVTKVSIDVIDIAGRVVLTPAPLSSGNHAKIDLAYLSKGIYFLNIRKDYELIKVQRVLKN